ncbi:hypothetical protein G352_10302 [Rhodococcus ruber BKS 20-38]|uniref:Uncharacterized protein n=1 Tax=Rhodococcus ruber BKS 20-38 TaxID=1278076 RepID=M2YTU3_9NOCA|nr:hypothetical protein [Rhodococcus ruber]EME65370.1 hypothetical protein G352_10302 [Rhodococcus ruber BKS 20-38]
MTEEELIDAGQDGDDYERDGYGLHPLGTVMPTDPIELFGEPDYDPTELLKNVRCRCGRKHHSYLSLARCVWQGVKITGDGRYAYVRERGDYMRVWLGASMNDVRRYALRHWLLHDDDGVTAETFVVFDHWAIKTKR